MIFDIHQIDFSMIDLNLLKTLDALLDERNVTRAAHRLSVTQPAVSAMLTRLRQSFDDPLFIRTQRGITPTARALALEEPVKKLLADVEVLLQPPSFDPAIAEMTITIAATDYALATVIVPFLSVMRDRAPGITTVVLPVRPERLHQQFQRGEIDLALITPDTTPPDLHSRTLFDERYVCMMRADHPDAAQKALSLERFCGLDHALVSYVGGSLSGVTDEALSKLGRKRRVTVSVTSFLVLPHLLRTSDLIAVVPRRLSLGVPDMAVFDPPIEVPGFTKNVVWHKRTHHAPGHRWVREVLLQACDGLTG